MHETKLIKTMFKNNNKWCANPKYSKNIGAIFWYNPVDTFLNYVTNERNNAFNLLSRRKLYFLRNLILTCNNDNNVYYIQ